MISAIEWVPEGVADPNPKKYEFSPAELDLIEMMEKQSIAIDGDEPAAPEPKKKETKKNIELPKVAHDLPADLRMDEYSSDEDENDAVQGTTIGRLLVDSSGMEDSSAILGKKSRKYDEDMDSDSDDDLNDIPDTREFAPLNMEGINSLGLSHVGTNAPSYMNLNADGEEEDDASDNEDVQIQPGDAIVVVAKTEEDFATLEVNVYEQKTGNLFVHHDIPLPAFPLCLAHGDISPSGTAGNFCAVGTFGPGIEIWNLDVLNALEPSCVLGGEDTTMADEIMRHNLMNASKKNDTKLNLSQTAPGLKPGSHTEAVMSLSWNKVHRQVIASGSSDCTVKLWDVTRPDNNSGTFTHHKDKVQSVLWHPQEGTLLATGSYDKTVALVDARASQETAKRVKIPADCESIAWDPFNPQCLTVASEDGTISCWDVRNFSEKTPLWSMIANEYGGVSDISYNSLVPGLLVSCSVDKTVTLWDTKGASPSSKPHPCGSKDMGVGKLYSVNFYPSSPWLLGCAGGGKEIALWDLTREGPIQNRFGDRATGGTVYNTRKETAEQQEAFDAMMKAKDSSTTSEADETPKKEEQKKKNPASNKKKKAHRARR